MYKAFLIKYAEIGVKGKNRDLFEEALVRQIKYALKRCEGEFRVRRTRGRIYIDVLSDDYDYEETIDNLKTVCGVSAICPMVQLEDEGFDKLCESAVSYMDEHYPDKNITFKVNARRARKTILWSRWRSMHLSVKRSCRRSPRSAWTSTILT